MLLASSRRLFMALLLSPFTLAAQSTTEVKASTVVSRTPVGVIDGIVNDTTMAPLRGAFVSIVRTNIRVGTGPNGRFRITNVPVGEYLLIIRRGGFRPTSQMIEVTTDTARVSYTLTPEITTLAAVSITEKAFSPRMLEFEARRKFGMGEFLTQDQIERHNAVFPTELFRTFGTINVAPNRNRAMTEYFALSKREGANPSLGACPMQVLLDGVQTPAPFNLDNLPPPRDIAGIEVYAGPASTPAQYNGYNRGCGVILVWTKDGY